MQSPPSLPEPNRRDERAELMRAKRIEDWHHVQIMGAELAVVFVFTLPLLALGVELAAVLVAHTAVNVLTGFDHLLWICAGGIATMIWFAYKGAKNGSLLFSLFNPDSRSGDDTAGGGSSGGSGRSGD